MINKAVLLAALRGGPGEPEKTIDVREDDSHHSISDESLEDKSDDGVKKIAGQDKVKQAQITERD